MPIRCEIVSQDRMVFEGDADIVLAPGEAGIMGILPRHAPLLSTLKYLECAYIVPVVFLGENFRDLLMHV